MKKLYLIILLLHSFGVLSALSQTNMVCNPGFEFGYTTDWDNGTNGGGVAYSVETTEVYSGSKALRADVNTADDWRNWIRSCSFDLVQGHSYKLTVMAKTVSGGAANVKIKVLGPNVVDILGVSGGNWSSIVYNFNADANYSGAQVRISFMNVESYIIDDVVLEDVSYFDCNGDLNGLAYIDNCNECVGGNTGVASTCNEVKASGNIKTLSRSFFGFNSKSLQDDNFMKDINIIEAWKKTHAKIYRYPGGTYGNSFDWHTGTTVVGGRPGDFNPAIKPADLVKALPDDVEILWMANIRIPMPETGYDWRTLTRAELLSDEVLQAKKQDVLDGLAAFEAAGKPVKYLELGNEFYFSDSEGLGELHGAGGDGGDYQGDHFPYDKNPAVYIEQMGIIAEVVKQTYPDIKIAVIRSKSELGASSDWNNSINAAFRSNTKVSINIDAVTNHWYQKEVWYDAQTANMPAITDVASSKTALGFAYDYIKHKKAYDIPGTPSGKELWITEGDIKDPSVDDTWLDGIREGIIQLNYLMMDHITMNTPHMFQPNYVESDGLKLTPKGMVASMIYAAGEGMSQAEELAMGGANFTGQFLGPYPELQGVKFSNASGEERFVLINCSNNIYSNLDMSSLISVSNLKAYQRSCTTPWATEKPTEQTSSVVSSSISLSPYSITILAEQFIIDDLVEYDFIVRNPSGMFPDNYVKLFNFGYEKIPGNTYNQNLDIKNDGTSTLTLANSPLSLADGTYFNNSFRCFRRIYCIF
jgi:hypothetical protein